MNCHKTEGRGNPLGRGTREQRLAKKEARKSSWKWPLFISISLQVTRKIESR